MINRNIFLHMPKEMLAAILEQLPNPVYAIQDDYTVLYANREAQSILNVHPGMQLREKDGVLTAPGWEQETMLSQETSIQDIYRVSVNGTGYLCFQKYIPESLRARINAFQSMCIMAASSVLTVLMGMLGEWMDYRMVVTLSAGMTLLVCFATIFRRRKEIRKIYEC